MDYNKSEAEVLLLENHLCFPLYACSRETIKLYKPYLSKLDLTYTQYVAMLVIWERQQLTSRELGRKLHLDSGTLTPLLKKLESKGYLERKRSKEDERNLIVTVTEKGWKLREEALSIPESMSSCVNLEPEEASELYRLLYKVLGTQAR